jgi:hypothetical protein
LNLYKAREYRETPLLDNIHEIVELISPNYSDSKEALMSLFYAVILEKENDRKPDQYYEISYRDGRESLNFLFDIINDYAGYTDLYYDEMSMSEQEWRDKVKPMRTNYDNPYLQDNYPHILFVIEKPEKLFEIQDQRAKDWVDALILRVYNSERYRKHFPVILESSS